MAHNPHDVAKAIKRFIAELGFRLSAIGFETGIDRHRLERFLAGVSPLRNCEISAVMKLLDLAVVQVESIERRSRNAAANNVQHSAIANDIVSRGLAYISDGENATGTFVTIGQREFIATAAHSLPSSLTSILLVGKGKTSVERQMGRFVVAMGKFKGGEPDVGYLEVEPETAKRLGNVPIEIDRLGDAGPGQAGRNAFLFGFPFELIRRRVDHKRQEEWIGVQSITYPMRVLAIDEWPSVSRRDKPRRKTIDVFLPYDVTEEVIVDPNDKRNRLPHPKGVSGGGIWQSFADKDGLWHSDAMKLIAIQSAWDEKRKYVRGVQIRHWIRLVRRDYPDLRRELKNVAKF